MRGCHLPEGVVSAGALLEANLEQDADQCPPVPDITNKPGPGLCSTISKQLLKSVSLWAGQKDACVRAMCHNQL